MTFVLPYYEPRTYYHESNIHYSNTASKRESVVVDKALYSLCLTQENYHLIILTPESQADRISYLSLNHVNVTIFKTSSQKDDCWVSIKERMILEYLKSSNYLENLVFSESDQLFFRNMMQISDTCEGADIGFTFTNKVPSNRRKHQSCLNSGIIYVKKATKSVLDFFQEGLQRLDKFIDVNGCHGGSNQNILCQLTAGYLEVGKIRNVSQELKICSVPRDVFNPERTTCVPKGDLKKVYLSHFVGSKKRSMLKPSCMLEFRKKFASRHTEKSCDILTVEGAT